MPTTKSSNPKPRLRTPGEIIATRYLEWVSAQDLAAKVKPTIPGVNVNNPAALAQLRELQSTQLRKLVNYGAAATAVGFGGGLLRHKRKITDARDEFDELDRAEKRANSAIMDTLLWPFREAKRQWTALGEVSKDPGPWDVPLGPLPKGWVVPAVALGAPAALLAGEAAADALTDRERDRLIKQRKARVAREFAAMLATATERPKTAGADAGSSVALLDRMAKQANAEMSTLARGVIFSWWLASGILAFRGGNQLAKRVDVGAREQRALSDYEHYLAVGKAPRVRLVPTGSSVATPPAYEGAGVAVPFPVAHTGDVDVYGSQDKRADAPTADGNWFTRFADNPVRTLGDTARGVRDTAHGVRDTYKFVSSLDDDTRRSLRDAGPALKKVAPLLTPENIEQFSSMATPENLQKFKDIMALADGDNLNTVRDGLKTLNGFKDTFAAGKDLLSKGFEAFKPMAISALNTAADAVGDRGTAPGFGSVFADRLGVR